MKYFNINGIPTDSQTNSSVAFEYDKYFFITSDDNTEDIDIQLFSLEQKVAIKLFGSLQKMYNLPFNSKYSWGGISSDIEIPC
ncbi:hypothetical protein [Bernardetia sp. MNP-M8]|uniref:hypothetical protein n=1 Tax=Bernardetia sp. MNP-M8 TaxID=3127470 RepID=UPI0030D43E2D